MVELASKKFVCIVDDTKLVSGLGGSKLAMPVEVTPFCYKARAAALSPVPIALSSHTDSAPAVQPAQAGRASGDQGLRRQAAHEGRGDLRDGQQQLHHRPLL
jgi:hypothetical protein